MLEGLIENSLVIMVGLLATAGFGGLVGYFRKRTNCLQKVGDDMEDMKKRAYRIEKALIILTKMQDDAIEKTHPELKTEWEEIVKELLSNKGHKIESFTFFRFISLPFL